jgi:hypothetical protein
MTERRFSQKVGHIQSYSKIEKEVSEKLPHGLQLLFGLAIKEKLILRATQRTSLLQQKSSCTSKVEEKQLTKELNEIKISVPSNYFLKDSCKLFLHVLLFK